MGGECRNAGPPSCGPLAVRGIMGVVNNAGSASINELRGSEMSNQRQDQYSARRKQAESTETRAAVNGWAVRMLKASVGFEHSGAYTGTAEEEDRSMLRVGFGEG